MGVARLFSAALCSALLLACLGADGGDAGGGQQRLQVPGDGAAPALPDQVVGHPERARSQDPGPADAGQTDESSQVDESSPADESGPVIAAPQMTAGAAESDAGVDDATPVVEPEMSMMAAEVGTMPELPVPGAEIVEDATPCDLQRAVKHLDGAPITVGDLCDDLVLCADDAETAEALGEVVSDLDCRSGENVLSLCAGRQVPCVLRPGVLDNDELAQVCGALSVFEQRDAHGLATCVVYF